MHSSRMCTTRSRSSHPPARAGTPLEQIPLEQTPPEQTPWEQTAPCGQIDTCKNITLANFVCGR